MSCRATAIVYRNGVVGRGCSYSSANLRDSRLQIVSEGVFMSDVYYNRKRHRGAGPFLGLVAAIAIGAGCSSQGLETASPSSSGPVGPAAQSASGTYPAYQAADVLAKSGVFPEAARLLWHNESSRLVAVWQLDEAGKVAQAATIGTTVNTEWAIKGTGDFDKDGNPDILWQHKTSRALGLWRLNGLSIIGGGSLPTPGAGWTLAGVADFNGDLSPDILWHNPTTGVVSYWAMDGTRILGAFGVGQAPSTPGWAIGAVGKLRTISGPPSVGFRNPISQQTLIGDWSGPGSNFSSYATNSGPFGLEGDLSGKADIDGDGLEELLVFNRASLNVVATNRGFDVLVGKASSGSWNLVGSLAPSTPPITAQSRPGEMRDAVYDPTRQRVYLSNPPLNRIEVYDAASKSFLTPFQVGPQPEGLDLTADGSKLLVCASGSTALQVLDLSADPPSISNVDLTTVGVSGPQTRQPYSVACASNNKAVISCKPSGTVLILDLNSGSLNQISGSSAELFLKPSPDRNVVLGTEHSGGLYRYSAIDDQLSKVSSFYQEIGYYTGPVRAAIDNVGNMLAESKFFDPQGYRRATVGFGAKTSYAPATFAAGSNYAFRVYNRVIEVLDVTRAESIYSQPLPLKPRAVIAGSDPQHFFVYSSNEIAEAVLPANFAPLADPSLSLKSPINQAVSLLIPAHDPEGQSLQFTCDSLPAGATLGPNDGRLDYLPTSETAPTTIVVHVSDGQNSVDVNVTLEALPSQNTSSVIPYGGELKQLVVDSAQGVVYASNPSKNRLERFDYLNRRQLEPFPLAGSPLGMDLSPDGSALYVTESGATSIARIDLIGSQPVRRYYLETPGITYGQRVTPGQVAVTNQGRAAVSNSFSEELRGIDLDTGTVTRGSNKPSKVRRNLSGSAVATWGYNPKFSTVVFDATLRPYDVLAPDTDDCYFDSTGSIVLTGFPLVLYSNRTELVRSALTGQQLTWNSGPHAYLHSGGTTVTQVSVPALTIESVLSLPTAAKGPMVQSADGHFLFVICQDGLGVCEIP